MQLENLLGQWWGCCFENRRFGTVKFYNQRMVAAFMFLRYPFKPVPMAGFLFIARTDGIHMLEQRLGAAVFNKVIQNWTIQSWSNSLTLKPQLKTSSCIGARNEWLWLTEFLTTDCGAGKDFIV
jgi:hypothetical protein